MVKETIALRATVEPRLMREITTPKMKEMMIAFRGMGCLGFTLDNLGQYWKMKGFGCVSSVI